MLMQMCWITTKYYISMLEREVTITKSMVMAKRHGTSAIREVDVIWIVLFEDTVLTLVFLVHKIANVWRLCSYQLSQSDYLISETEIPGRKKERKERDSCNDFQ